MNRKLSFKKNNNKKKLLFHRPHSAKRISTTFLVKNNISTIRVQAPPLLMTHPNNNAKKLKGMGNNFEREELYQINMQLKEAVNSLKVELYEAKSQIVKKEREIKKKEKIIEDCYKEIHNPTSLYMQSFDKAKESTLLTLCKEQYNQLKNNYDQKLEEIEILKANIKITKIKEYQIDIDVLKKEMNKLRYLYYDMISENNELKNEISELNEYREKCNEQHNLINKCVKQVEDYNNNSMELELKNDNLQAKLEQNKKKNKLMKNKNNKLQMNNEKFLRERKNRERFKMFNADNVYKITNLEKELAEYKKLNIMKDQRLQELEKQVNDHKANKSNYGLNKIQAFNYQNIQQIEKEPIGTQDENLNKISLLKSLLEEKKQNLEKLKSFLYMLDFDPERIIQYYNPNLNVSENNNWSDIYKINGFGSNNSMNNNGTINFNNNESNNRFNNPSNIETNNNENNNNFNSNDFNNNGNTNNLNGNEFTNNNNLNTNNENNEEINNNESNSQLYNAAVIHEQNSNDQEQI